MDYIVHPGTGTIMAARECLRVSANILDNIDTDDYLELQDALDQHAVPIDSAIHIVSVGNPHDGITLYGMFLTADEAGEWAEQHIDDVWQVVTPQTGIW